MNATVAGSARMGERPKLPGAHEPALTVIVTGILDATWHHEIEAIAAL